MKAFILMLTFLTRIPIPMNFKFEEKDFAKGLWFLPFVGLIIGLPLWVLYSYVPIENQWLKAILCIVLYLLITGGLHLDGLADYFDGIFSSRKKERILEIMKDVHIGTFGVIGLVLYFLVMIVTLKDASALAVLLMPVVGRAMGHMSACLGKYPRNNGMGMAMIRYGKWWHLAIVMMPIIALCFALGLKYVIAICVSIIFTALVVYRTTQLIDGVTGDVLGAVIEMNQGLWLITLIIIGG